MARDKITLRMIGFPTRPTGQISILTWRGCNPLRDDDCPSDPWECMPIPPDEAAFRSAMQRLGCKSAILPEAVLLYNQMLERFEAMDSHE